jgi:hypothetical protein
MFVDGAIAGFVPDVVTVSRLFWALTGRQRVDELVVTLASDELRKIERILQKFFWVKHPSD